MLQRQSPPLGMGVLAARVVINHHTIGKLKIFFFLKHALLTFKKDGNYRLVKLFRVLHHLLEHLPRFVLVRTGEAKLFNFLKLMNTEKAKLVSSMGASFCSKAGRVTSISRTPKKTYDICQ